MNRNAEDESEYSKKMQEKVARAEFMELAKNLHRLFLNRLDLHDQPAWYI